MIDLNQVRLKIRHFLLQQSGLFHRSLEKGSDTPAPTSAIARELSKKINLPERRLQKYLTKELGPKEITITLTDMEQMASLKQLPLSHFIAYLLEEQFSNELVGWKRTAIDFFQNLHEAHRRALNATLFLSKNQKKNERLIELIIQVYSLGDQDLSTIESIVSAFKAKNTLRNTMRNE